MLSIFKQMLWFNQKRRLKKILPTWRWKNLPARNKVYYDSLISNENYISTPNGNTISPKSNKNDFVTSAVE